MHELNFTKIFFIILCNYVGSGSHTKQVIQKQNFLPRVAIYQNFLSCRIHEEGKNSSLPHNCLHRLRHKYIRVNKKYSESDERGKINKIYYYAYRNMDQLDFDGRVDEQNIFMMVLPKI